MVPAALLASDLCNITGIATNPGEQLLNESQEHIVQNSESNAHRGDPWRVPLMHPDLLLYYKNHSVTFIVCCTFSIIGGLLHKRSGGVTYSGPALLL